MRAEATAIPEPSRALDELAQPVPMTLRLVLVADARDRHVLSPRKFMQKAEGRAFGGRQRAGRYPESRGGSTAVECFILRPATRSPTLPFDELFLAAEGRPSVEAGICLLHWDLCNIIIL